MQGRRQGCWRSCACLHRLWCWRRGTVLACVGCWPLCMCLHWQQWWRGVGCGVIGLHVHIHDGKGGKGREACSCQQQWCSGVHLHMCTSGEVEARSPPAKWWGCGGRGCYRQVCVSKITWGQVQWGDGIGGLVCIDRGCSVGVL